jgi:hypothetical protein
MRGILPVLILAALLLAGGCTKEVPSQQVGSLEITSTPAGLAVQVILDGNYQGVTPLNLTNLSAGSHLLQLRSPGYAEKVELVTISAGQAMKVSADYPPLPTAMPPETSPPVLTETNPGPTENLTTIPETPVPPGGLYINSFPAGATIYLNGKGYGVTPNFIPNLTPGSYELRLSLVGWKDYKIVLSISPGKNTTEEAYLPS